MDKNKLRPLACNKCTHEPNELCKDCRYWISLPEGCKCCVAIGSTNCSKCTYRNVSEDKVNNTIPNKILVTTSHGGLTKVRLADQIEDLEHIKKTRVIEKTEGTGANYTEALGNLMMKNYSRFGVPSVTILDINDYNKIED